MKTLISASIIAIAFIAVMASSTPVIENGNGLYGFYHTHSGRVADTGGVYDRRF